MDMQTTISTQKKLIEKSLTENRTALENSRYVVQSFLNKISSRVGNMDLLEFSMVCKPAPEGSIGQAITESSIPLTQKHEVTNQKASATKTNGLKTRAKNLQKKRPINKRIAQTELEIIVEESSNYSANICNGAYLNHKTPPTQVEDCSRKNQVTINQENTKAINTSHYTLETSSKLNAEQVPVVYETYQNTKRKRTKKTDGSLSLANKKRLQGSRKGFNNINEAVTDKALTLDHKDDGSKDTRCRNTRIKPRISYELPRLNSKLRKGDKHTFL